MHILNSTSTPSYNLLPLGNRLVAVIPSKPTDGIVVPDSVSNPAPYGLVQAVGPDVKLFSVGDRILFLPTNSIGIEHEGQELFVLSETAVFAKLEPKA